MKKGDLRKQEILNTAEQLFCRKGYEETSIQDILDRLNCSKGSFYHHFISKESLLAEMCRKRAEQNFETAALRVSEDADPAGNLNELFSGMIPLREEKISFLMMFLPIFRLPEGKSVRNSYCDALADCFRREVIRQLSSGKEKGMIPCADSETTADICLTLVNRLWVTACEMIISAEEEGKEADIAELLSLTDEYRTAMERILTLPYGSLELISIPMMKATTEQIHNHWQPKNMI